MWGRVHKLEQQLIDERDRRYAELAVEREKAIKIKEEADRRALELARDIQKYKDEKANELREQINSERGLYVTKDDLVAAVSRLEAMISPLTAYVAGDQGRSKGTIDTTRLLLGLGGLVVAALSVWLVIST